MYAQENLIDFTKLHHDTEKIKKNWIYIIATDTIKGAVVEHTPAQAFCGHGATASVTIIKLQNGENARILSLCNLSVIDKGKSININPMTKPEFSVSLPWLSSSGNNRGEYLINSAYNLEVLNTYWGHINKD